MEGERDEEEVVVYHGLPTAAESLAPVSARKLMKVYGKLKARERWDWGRNVGRLVLGVAILLALPGLVLVSAWNLKQGYWPHQFLWTKSLMAVRLNILMFATVAMGVAVWSKRDSRAQMVDQFLKFGYWHAQPAFSIRAYLWGLVLLGAMIGAFMVVDAVRMVWTWGRVALADREQVALMLARIAKSPAGIDPRMMALGGDVMEIRMCVGYLVAHGWADISPDGDHLTLVPRKHRVFEAGVFGE